MGTLYCLICDGEIPEGRKLTCSHECYVQLSFHKEEFKKDIAKKPETMGALHVNIRRKPWQKELDRYNRQGRITPERQCDICRRWFMPKQHNQYCCSPTCQNLKAHGYTNI